MLSQLTRQRQSYSRLNLTRGYGRLLIVASQTRSLLRQFLKDIVDERVHDPHRLRWNSSVGMHLKQTQKTHKIRKIAPSPRLVKNHIAFMANNKRRKQLKEKPEPHACTELQKLQIHTPASTLCRCRSCKSPCSSSPSSSCRLPSKASSPLSPSLASSQPWTSLPSDELQLP